MKVQRQNIAAMMITDAPGLDPVDVMFIDESAGRGRVMIACFGEAWAASWSAMGEDRTVSQFFAECDNGYLTERLCSGRGSRKRLPYLSRIVTAVQAALKFEAETAE